jgi:hypothetical protein
VFAWDPVDACRLVTVSPSGLSLLMADGTMPLLTALDQVEDGTATTVTPQGVYVAGTTVSGKPVVELIDGGASSTVALPAPVTAVVALLHTHAQVLAVAETKNHQGTLLRLDGTTATPVGTIPLAPTRAAWDGKVFVVGGMTARSTQALLVGTPGRWRRHTLPASLDVRAVAIDGGRVGAALEEISNGAPVAARFLLSSDGGRRWSEHREAGADVAALVLHRADAFASMAIGDGKPNVYTSPDGATWSALPGVPASESIPGLATAGSTLWAVGDVIARLPLP